MKTSRIYRLVVLGILVFTSLILPFSTTYFEAAEETGNIGVLVVDKNYEPMASAKIFLDGNPKGKTNSQGTLLIEDVETGKHQVVTKKEGYKKAEKTVEVEPDKTVSVVLQLERVEAGRLKVSVEDNRNCSLPGAKVYLDGRLLGETNSDGIIYVEKIKEGQHALTAKQSGYRTDKKKVIVKPGKTVSVLLKLKKVEIKKEKQLTNFSRGAQDPVIKQVSNGAVWLIGHYAQDWQVFYMKSSDGGRTWSDPRQLSSGGYGCYDIDVAKGYDGRIWVMWSASPPDQKYDLFYRTTTNYGKTWSEVERIKTPEDHDTVPSIVPISGSKVGVFWEGNYSISLNGGKRWSPIREMPSYGWNNVTLHRTRDGRLWILNYSPSKEAVEYQVSNDGGKHWSKRKEIASVPAPTSEVPAIRPVPKMLESSDGRLWVTWYAYVSADTKSWNPFAEKYTSGATQVFYSMSQDGGRTWSPPTQITDQPSYHGDYFSNVSLAQIGAHIWVVYSVFEGNTWQIHGRIIGEVIK